MALLKPGYWQTTYWPSSFWQEDFWVEYGVTLYTMRQLVINAIDLRFRTTVGALAPKSVRQKIMEAADTRFRTLT